MRILVVGLLLACISAVAIANEYAPQKVVYHINYLEPTRLAATFTNINNHLDAVGEDRLDIKVMVHGPAVEFFIAASTDSAKQISLDSLRLQGVQFLVCGNTLSAYGVALEDLYEVEHDDVVPAGLPALVSLQQQGYYYLRP